MPSRFPLADSAGLVLQEITGLLRSEIRLMKAELRQNVAALRGGLVLAATAGVLAILGLGVLFDAAVAALMAQGLSPAMAGLAVGGRGASPRRASRLDREPAPCPGADHA